MAHFILEYSTNINSNTLALRELFAKLHQTAASTGLFPQAGLRSRAHPCQDFFVADGRPEFAFVHLNFRIGSGRTEAEQLSAFTALREVFLAHFEPLSSTQGVALSFEMTELPEKLRHNHNTVRDHL